MRQINNRLGEEKLNNQGCLMKIINYNNARDIIVEFQDEYKAKIKTEYGNYKKGNVKNPYYPSVYGVGIIGSKYQTCNLNRTKEYKIWCSILQRCFDEKTKEKWSVYNDAICCEEWLLFENFYNWLHSQDNFQQWLNGERWDIDKDILIKGNKIYSPETCILIPHNVNSLFTKSDRARGKYPIGVSMHGKKYQVSCHNTLDGKREFLGTYDSPQSAFRVYKKYKENLIKQVAEQEYNKGNITNECYRAMIDYKVEITD